MNLKPAPRTKRILCPTDFSECSKKALAEAEKIAKEHDAKLFVLHVDISGSGTPPGYRGYSEEFDQHRRLMDEGTPAEKEIEYELHYMRGQPVDEIRRFASLRDIDLIVMGTHGRSGIAKFMMGSVAEQISSDSPCPVVMTPLVDPVETATDSVA